MLRTLGLVVLVVLVLAIGIVYAAGKGMFGEEWHAGEPTASAVSSAVVDFKESTTRESALDVGVARPKQILFGDLHVHSTFSFDAFTLSLPMSGGDGAHPVSDACDFARHCSSLDFWSINDHAITLTPRRWSETVEAIRQCNDIAGSETNPDLVTYLGWEWTQVGATPETHYGHKNVIIRGLDDTEIPARPIAAGAPLGIDDINEALAPTGETKWIELEDGTMHLGYDTRDVDGDPVGTSPWEYSSNEAYNDGSIELASAIPEGLEAPEVLLAHDGGIFGGQNQPIEVAHEDAQAASEGTWAFSFSADNPGNGQNQALFSKDHSGFEDGGHLTAYITGNGVLKVRFQSETEEKYLVDWGTKIEAGEDYHFAFTFDDDEIGFEVPVTKDEE